MRFIQLQGWPQLALFFPADEIGQRYQFTPRAGLLKQSSALVNAPAQEDLLRLQFTLLDLLLRVALCAGLLECLHTLAARYQEPLLVAGKLGVEAHPLEGHDQVAAGSPGLCLFEQGADKGEALEKELQLADRVAVWLDFVLVCHLVPAQLQDSIALIDVCLPIEQQK